MKKFLFLSALLMSFPAFAAPLDLQTYAKLRSGMNEGQVLEIAGKPDMVTVDSERPVIVKSYYYLPSDNEPTTTRVIFSAGTVTDIQRDRKF